jgi:hypothetical protein
MSSFHVRQGDVLLLRIDDAPVRGKRIARDAGRIVLAYGEITGHAHAIASRDAALYELPVDTSSEADAVWQQAQRLLTVRRPVKLQHEEHATIRLPAGNYRVIRQREYSPEAIRNVAD